jgi:hypothetical protein
MVSVEAPAFCGIHADRLTHLLGAYGAQDPFTNYRVGPSVAG